MPSYTLVDGNARHEKYPDTFEMPSEAARAAVQPGDCVKVGLEVEGGAGERMWFQVISRGVDSFIGILGNNPVVIEDIKRGDELSFESKNILCIWED